MYSVESIIMKKERKMKRNVTAEENNYKRNNERQKVNPQDKDP